MFGIANVKPASASLSPGLLGRYTAFGLSDAVEIRSRARVGGVLDEKWTLERLLGIGGMAAVYGARHRNGARAAVKVLHPHLASHEDVRERFRREGYAANRVEHPGAVKVLDDDVVARGPDAGTAYLVMELLEGESLQDRLERGVSMSELEFLRIADEVLDVLQAAHARGVVHRDLKPENLFLLRDPEPGKAGVKVLDFGLARLLQGQTITSYGLALGTPSFMSPEQAAGRIDEIDGRTDLFALGATGFRVRTGRRVHEAPNAVELVRKMMNLAAPRIRSVARDVSDPFARVVDRALEFRRGDRYANAQSMKKDVERAMIEIDAAAGATQKWMSPALGTTVDDRVPTVVLHRSDIEHPRLLPPHTWAAPRPAFGRRAWLVSAMVGVILIGGVGAKRCADGRPSPEGARSGEIARALTTGASIDSAVALTPLPPAAEPALAPGAPSLVVDGEADAGERDAAVSPAGSRSGVEGPATSAGTRNPRKGGGPGQTHKPAPQKSRSTAPSGTVRKGSSP